ncbi:MAG: hypothetical protein ACRBB5_06205 [Nitrosopumilus sp.]
MIPLLIGLIVLLPNINAEKIIYNLEGGMDVEIIHPNEVVVRIESVISFLVKNNWWEDKQDISFVFSSYDNILAKGLSDSIIIDKLARGGIYGESIDLLIPSNTKPRIYFLNLRYSQVLVANNEFPNP